MNSREGIMPTNKVVDLKGNPMPEDKLESLKNELAASFVSFERGVKKLRELADSRPDVFRMIRIDYTDGGVDSVPSIVRRIQNDLEFISIA